MLQNEMNCCHYRSQAWSRLALFYVEEAFKRFFLVIDSCIIKAPRLLCRAVEQTLFVFAGLNNKCGSGYCLINFPGLESGLNGKNFPADRQSIMHKFNYLNCFVFSVFLALVLAPAAIAGNAVTVDTVATAGEHFPAEKSEVMKYTDPEEIILNDNLAQIGGYFSRPRLLKLLGGSRRVVLTFDDGPHPRTTPQVLEILRQRNIKAIFFVLGVQAQKFPELVKQIHDEGHLIGNHSYSHKNLAQVSSEKMHDEINRTSRLIESITGRRPAFLRPPYGAMNRNVLRAAKTEGMDIVLWTIDPKDWHSKNELSVLRQVDRQMGFNGGDLRGGAILLHDIYPSTVRALGPMLDRLAANEYRVTSIDRLDSSSATFWAAAEPNLSRQAIGRQSFRVENSGNQILINLLREKKKSESSAMAMLKAQRRGNFVLFLAQNS